MGMWGTLSPFPGFRSRLARRPTRRRATKAGVALISSPSASISGGKDGRLALATGKHLPSEQVKREWRASLV